MNIIHFMFGYFLLGVISLWFIEAIDIWLGYVPRSDFKKEFILVLGWPIA